MPRKPKHQCKTPSCPHATRATYCVDCAATGKGTATGKVRDERASPSVRGYDRAWQRLRLWYLRRHPLCEECRRADKVVPAEQVHHVVAFKGKDDPLRLDPTNLEALCVSCHNRKTSEGQRVT